MLGRRLRRVHDADGRVAHEAALLFHLERIAAARYGEEGYYVDGERRRIPDHWHAHARPAGGFFDPRSALYEP